MHTLIFKPVYAKELYSTPVLAALFLSFSATYAPCKLSAQSLSLPEALALAERNNPRLKVSDAQIDVAQAGTITALTRPNPNFGVQSGRQFVRVPGNVTGLVSTFSFSQPLELGPLRQSRSNLAKSVVESSQEARRAVRLAVLVNVRRSFFEVLRRNAEISIYKETLALVEDLRKRIEVRVQVGEAGRLELIRAEAEVATARTQSNSAQLLLVSAFAQFRAALGVPIDPNTKLTGTLDLPITLPPLAEIERQTLSSHPSLALAKAEVRRAQARISNELALRRPQPTVRVDYERYPDVPTFRAGIDIPLPLFNKRQGPIAESNAALRQAMAVEQSQSLELLAALEGAYRRYEVATTQLSAFQEGLLREAEEGVRASTAAYNLGERGVLEVLDAQRVLRTVSLDFIRAQYDRQAALIDLDELRAKELGNPTP
jgi:outer membrane protein, heavy metal efflux system